MKIINLVEDTKGAEGCAYEHGLSFYIETENHKVLLDTGATDAFLQNAEKLGIDLKQVDTVVISHGHYDHTGGLLSFVRLNPEARIYIQKTAQGAFYNYRNQEEKYIGMDKRISDLQQVIFLEGDLQPDEELYLFTGVTGRKLWPKGNEILKRKSGNEFIQDDFCHEQYLVVTEGDKKVLLSGCAHNGILNILDKYEELLGGYPTHVISGFHMMKKNDYTEEDTNMIEETAHILSQMDTYFYSGHCTGEYPLRILNGIMKDKLTEIHSGEIVFQKKFVEKADCNLDFNQIKCVL